MIEYDMGAKPNSARTHAVRSGFLFTEPASSRWTSFIGAAPARKPGTNGVRKTVTAALANLAHAIQGVDTRLAVNS